FAVINGSAKTGTAALTRNEDLTAALGGTTVGPPLTIAAFPSGNGGQDERIVSATYRAGRLWLASTTSCQPATDTAPRACAAYVSLNTSATPAAVVESAVVADVGRDTFLPLVGFSRDGGAYFVMSGSS